MYRVREGGRKKGRKDRRMRKKEGGREKKRGRRRTADSSP